MIPKECKRLAEVDFPIAEVSKHSAREKSIRHGHPSTLHLWWARRPLASCRAMLLGLLWPDPCDPHCPDGFKGRARQLLPTVQGKAGPADEDLRRALLKFIGDFANWDLSSNRTYLEVSRELMKAAHGEEPPLVVDPFAGGGSIPLEALRLGCEAFASDLNPVACLILKVMLEDIPRHGPELAEELRRVGAQIKQEAKKELAELYPKDPDGATPIAYLWARTVRCEAPNCGAEIPLMRSFWLCKKASRRRALRHRVVRPKGEPPQVEFEVFEPKTEKEVAGGTVTRAKATCLACGTVLPPGRVRAQLAEQRGGADVVFDSTGKRLGGVRMLAVVTLRPGEQGRYYRVPIERDYQAVWKAQKRLKEILDKWERDGRKGLCPVPDEPLPLMSGTFNAPIYGMATWESIFTARQKLTFITLIWLVRQRQGASPDAVAALLAMVCTKLTDRCNSLVNWSLGVECPNQLFKGNAIPMGWDFTESNVTSESSASIHQSIQNIANNVLASMVPGANPTCPELADACCSPLPDESCAMWFTDPPYYFAVPYADLSDFFFVWLKRALPGNSLLRDPFDAENPLTPKKAELCEMARWDPDRYRHKDKRFFEEGMTEAFLEGRRVLRKDGIGSVVFAHKTTEGWEALLSGMIRGGWTITGSWPIATERYSRIRARESAALATSVHLVCRPRPAEVPVGDWADVLRELPRRVGDWMERLQSEGVRGADLVFACIGPALEVFSRYSRVETADSREVKLAEYLEKVWEVVGRTALEQVLGTAEARAHDGAASAVEEDARLTALFLWTLQSTNGDLSAEASAQAGGDSANSGDYDVDGEDTSDEDEHEEATSRGKTKGYSLIFDVVRRFAQPLGINLPKWEGRIIETKKGVVRLLPVAERARQLFGEDGARAAAERLESTPIGDTLQLTLFPEFEAGATPKGKGRGRKKVNVNVPDEALKADREATTLDRVHVAMLLQASGRANALRALLKAEQERGPDFLRLANALSALYPKGSEEKRLLDAMLLAVPR
jgi:Adenine-specific DNA methylase containing a Zn-ribbon